jgi:hypothetical protein
MSESEGPKRRLVVPKPKATGTAVTVSRLSDVSSMLDGALRTLAEQLDKLALRSRVASFDEREAKVLQGYIRSLVELSKEERERDKQDQLGDLSKLSDTELLELARSKLAEKTET